LRVALFSDSALPVINGVSISVDRLATELRNLGHVVHHYAPGQGGHLFGDPQVHRFFAAETPWSKGYPLAFPPFVHLKVKFFQHQYDIVHTHTPWTVGFLGYRWARRRSVPVVSTYHTIYEKYAHYFPYLPTRAVRQAIAGHTERYYNSVDQVITPSDASRKWLIRRGVTTPITIIPTGVVLGETLTKEQERHRLGIPQDAFVLLFVGRLAAEKNLNCLLEMAAKVLKACPRAELCLVGDGPERECLEEFAQRNEIENRVRFVGFVDRSQVSRYYKAADVFTFSSVSETQGMVVNEALASGLPVVVVRGGGAPASVTSGQNGFIVRNDATDFAKPVIKLIQDDLLRNQMIRGALESAKNFSLESMVERVLEVYDRSRSIEATSRDKIGKNGD